jgi:hypothetical protein
MTEISMEMQGQQAAQRVAVLLAAYEAGQIADSEFRSAVSVAIYAGKILASRLADIFVSTLADRPPLGIAPGPQHLDRLTEAAQTLVEEPEGRPERLERLALAETLNSYRRTLHAAIAQQGFSFWQRIPATNPCEVCAPYAYEIRPVSYGFKDHPGCRCTLRPYGERRITELEVGEPIPEPAPITAPNRTLRIEV